MSDHPSAVVDLLARPFHERQVVRAFGEERGRAGSVPVPVPPGPCRVGEPLGSVRRCIRGRGGRERALWKSGASNNFRHLQHSNARPSDPGGPRLQRRGSDACSTRDPSCIGGIHKLRERHTARPVSVQGRPWRQCPSRLQSGEQKCPRLLYAEGFGADNLPHAVSRHCRASRL